MENLEQTLRDVVAASKLSLQDETDREQIMQKLRGVVAQSEYFRGASVVPYGSFVSQLSTRWGDLDISMDLDIPNSNAANALRYLESLLNEKDEEWQNVVYIPSARVPILKFDHGTISCDVSVNNRSSKLKTKLLSMISQMDPRFPDMVMLVKVWALKKDINGSSTNKTFNSYCLTLLVLYHFQTCEPPILPPLESICSNNVVEECNMKIANWRSNRFRRPVNRSSLSELFISFMNKFSNLWCWSMSKIDQICTSTVTTVPVPRNYNNRDSLIVLDPFENGYNVAKTVWKSSLPKISEAFKSTHDLLISPTRRLSRDELLILLFSDMRTPY